MKAIKTYERGPVSKAIYYASFGFYALLLIKLLFVVLMTARVIDTPRLKGELTEALVGNIIVLIIAGVAFSVVDRMTRGDEISPAEDADDTA